VVCCVRKSLKKPIANRLASLHVTINTTSGIQLLSYDTTFQLGDFYISPLADWNDTFLCHSDPLWIFTIILLLEDTYSYFAFHFQSKAGVCAETAIQMATQLPSI